MPFFRSFLCHRGPCALNIVLSTALTLGLAMPLTISILPKARICFQTEGGKRFEAPSQCSPGRQRGKPAAPLNRWVLLEVSVQPLKGLNMLDDHNDKYLQNNDILVGSGPSPAHWLGFFHFVDLVHEV